MGTSHHAVFHTVDEIEAGADFEARIRESIAGCQVCLLLIGPRWLGRREDGAPARILDDRDFVRIDQRVPPESPMSKTLPGGRCFPSPQTPQPRGCCIRNAGPLGWQKQAGDLSASMCGWNAF